MKKTLRYLLAFIILTQAVIAAPNPGHDPSSIGPGTFNNGNYTFPAYVGIGTNPTYPLDINTSKTGYALNIFNDGNNEDRDGIRIQAGADDGTGNTTYIGAYDGNGDTVGYIVNDGGTFQLVDVSDIRTKTNIQNTNIAGKTILNSLRVVDFQRKGQGNNARTLKGFIAQEVEQVYPYAVYTDEQGLKGIAPNAFIPLIIQAMQEMNDDIQSLQTGTPINPPGQHNNTVDLSDVYAEINALRAEVDALKTELATLKNNTNNTNNTVITGPNIQTSPNGLVVVLE